MSVKASDSIRSQSRGTAAQALAAVDRPESDDRAFMQALADNAPVVGIDFAIAASHTAQETAGWTSARWVNHGDPAGIGIPADNTPEPFPYRNGTESALVYLTCLNRLTADPRPEPWLAQINPQAMAWIDRVWTQHCREATAAGVTVRTIDDLHQHYRDPRGESQAAWMWNVNAGKEIAAWGNRLFAGIADQGATPQPPEVPTVPTERGHVPKPPVKQSWVTDKRVGAGREPDQQRVGRITGTVHHTMVGYLRGTDSYFHRQDVASLTDFGIGGPWDGDGLDGVIYEWIDQSSRIVPWANGTVGDARAPYGDAPAWLAQFGGVSQVNVRQRSIETSDGAQADRSKANTRLIESLCFLTAYVHAEEAGQTAETFAWNMHHREFGVDHQGCPGAWIINNVVAIQDRTKAIMRAYQEGAALSPQLAITYPPGWSGGTIPLPGQAGPAPVPTEPKWAPKHPLPAPPRTMRIGGFLFLAVNEGHSVRMVATRDVDPLEYAHPAAKPTGKPIAKGAGVNISHVTVGDDDNLWLVATSGSRFPADAFAPAA
jgi:hypothetical protein